LFFVIAFAALHSDILSKALKRENYLDLVVFLNYLFIAIVVLMFMPIIYLENVKIRGNGKIWIISEDGVEIYCPVEEHKGKLHLDITHNDPLAKKFMQLIKTEHSGTMKSIHDIDPEVDSIQALEQYMTFYRATLGNTYWTIVISYQEEEVYKVLSRFRNRLILIFSLFFIFIILYFYTLSKYRNVLKEETKR